MPPAGPHPSPFQCILFHCLIAISTFLFHCLRLFRFHCFFLAFFILTFTFFFTVSFHCFFLTVSSSIMLSAGGGSECPPRQAAPVSRFLDFVASSILISGEKGNNNKWRGSRQKLCSSLCTYWARISSTCAPREWGKR